MTVEFESKGRGRDQSLLMNLRTTFASGVVEDYGNVEMLVATVQVDAVDGQRVRARMFTPSVPIVDSTIVILVGGHRVESLQLMSFVWDFVRSGRIVILPIQRGTDLNESLPVTYGVLEVDDLQSTLTMLLRPVDRENVHVDVVAFSSGGNVALAALSKLQPRVMIRNLVIESPVDDVESALQVTSLTADDRKRVYELIESRRIELADFNMSKLADKVRPTSYMIIRGEKDEVVSESMFQKLSNQLNSSWGVGQLKRMSCAQHNMRVVDLCPLETIRSHDRTIVSFVNRVRN